MAAYIPSSLDVILPLIVNKLLADGVFSGPGLCFLSDNDDDPYYPPADRYAVVVAGGSATWDPAEIGGGRAVTVLDQEICVCVWQRNATDMAGNASRILTNQSMGLLALVHQAINSLQEYFPTDSQGNVYAVEGLRLVRQDKAIRKDKAEEWIRRRNYFKLNYQLGLTGTNPPG